jgi:hypothetical protein
LLLLDVALPSWDFGKAELTNADKELMTIKEQLFGISLAVGRDTRATKWGRVKHE